MYNQLQMVKYFTTVYIMYLGYITLVSTRRVSQRIQQDRKPPVVKKRLFTSISKQQQRKIMKVGRFLPQWEIAQACRTMHYRVFDVCTNQGVSIRLLCNPKRPHSFRLKFIYSEKATKFGQIFTLLVLCSASQK